MTFLSSAEPRAGSRIAAGRKLSRTVQPTRVERFLEPHRVIVSKTDLRGRIIYVNRTFMTISGYEEEELLGQPHSIIRHPDMPRCIFKLLWDLLGEGREVFAYVKNMARTGDFYWVFAHVTPSRGADGKAVGYHSNRRAPERRVLAEHIEPLYRRFLEIEASAPDRRIGLERSAAALAQLLRDKGLSYEEFVFSL
ncbi:MAG: PAS domain-containing protein [Pseudomonadota bacterium]